jgi:hypothetical protein
LVDAGGIAAGSLNILNHCSTPSQSLPIISRNKFRIIKPNLYIRENHSSNM